MRPRPSQPARSRRLLAAGVLAVPVLVVAAVALHAMYATWRGIVPVRTIAARPAVRDELAGLTDVTFRTTDGLLLRGWHVPSRNGASILLTHGHRANRGQVLSDARLFARASYGVLLFDLRANGESEGELATYGDHEQKDVTAALDFLAALPDGSAARVGAFGFSAGASPVALVAAVDPRIRAVVLASATVSMRAACDAYGGSRAFLTTPPSLLMLRLLGVDVEAVQLDRAAARIAPRSLFVVHGERDVLLPPSHARAIFDAAGQPKRLLIVAGAGHDGFAELDPEGYGKDVVRFFDEALRGQ